MCVFRLPQLLRLARLAKKFEKLAAAKAFRVVQLTCILLICAHWYACIWFWMGSSSKPGSDVVMTPGVNGTSWIYRLDMEDESLELKYTASLYCACLLHCTTRTLGDRCMFQAILDISTLPSTRHASK